MRRLVLLVRENAKLHGEDDEPNVAVLYHDICFPIVPELVNEGNEAWFATCVEMI